VVRSDIKFPNAGLQEITIKDSYSKIKKTTISEEKVQERNKTCNFE